MRSRRLLMPTLLAVTVLLTACGSEPEEASLDTAAEQAAEPADDPGATTQESTSAPARPADLEGSWTLVAGEADDVDAGTFVGYRVQEELRGVGATTAVGRTPVVTGELVIADGTVTSVDVVADLTELSSDSGNRDNALRDNGLETGTFPEGTFSLTSPIAIPEDALDGAAFTTPVTGELTLHGETNDVAFDLDAQLVGGSTIVAVAQIDIVMSDYGVSPPQLGPVLSISDEGVAELQLRFQRG